MKSIFLIFSMILGLRIGVLGCACCLDAEDTVDSKETRLAELPYPYSELMLEGNLVSTTSKTNLSIIGMFGRKGVSFRTIINGKQAEFNFIFNGTVERNFKSETNEVATWQHIIYGKTTVLDESQGDLLNMMKGESTLFMMERSNACHNPEGFYEWSMNFPGGSAHGKPDVQSDRQKARYKNDEGMKSYRNKKYLEAQVAFEMALQLDPYYMLARTNLASVFALTHEPLRAIEQLREAMKQNPKVVKQKMREDHDYDNIRSDSMFIELLNSK